MVQFNIYLNSSQSFQIFYLGNSSMVKIHILIEYQTTEYKHYPQAKLTWINLIKKQASLKNNHVWEKW